MSWAGEGSQSKSKMAKTVPAALYIRDLRRTIIQVGFSSTIVLRQGGPSALNMEQSGNSALAWSTFVRLHASVLLSPTRPPYQTAIPGSRIASAHSAYQMK